MGGETLRPSENVYGHSRALLEISAGKMSLGALNTLITTFSALRMYVSSVDRKIMELSSLLEICMGQLS